MRIKQLKANKFALSTLVIVLIVIIIVGFILTAVIAAVWLGFWRPLGDVVGSRSLDTETMDFTGFTTVKVGGGFEVEIDQSDSYSISITADDNMFDYITVSQTGETLIIGLEWSHTYYDVSLRARIAMPELYELEFSGGTQGNATGFASMHDFILTLSGGSRISMEGAANVLTVSGSGGSHLTLSDFPVHNATVNLSGGSSATVNLDGSLEGDVSGGSHLKYVGEPTDVDVNTSGGSTAGPE